MEIIILVLNIIILIYSIININSYYNGGITISTYSTNCYEFNEDLNNDGKIENIKINIITKTDDLIYDSSKLCVDGSTSGSSSKCTFYVDGTKIASKEFYNLEPIEICECENKKVLKIITEHAYGATQAYYDIEYYDFVNNEMNLVKSNEKIDGLLYYKYFKLEGEATTDKLTQLREKLQLKEILNLQKLPLFTKGDIIFRYNVDTNDNVLIPIIVNNDVEKLNEAFDEILNSNKKFVIEFNYNRASNFEIICKSINTR